jgi:hypothetical protein
MPNKEKKALEFDEEQIHFMLLSVNHFIEEMKRVNEFYISTVTDLTRQESLAVLNQIKEDLHNA